MKVTPAVLLVLCVLGLLAPGAVAQEAINTDAALQPPPGTLIYRQQFRYRSLEAPHGPAEAEMLMLASNFIYGVSERLTLIAGVPLIYREVEPNNGMDDREDFGIGDINALAKFQFYKDNFGIGSTVKGGLLFGAQLPSGDNDFSSDSIDPILGAVGTYAKDRHGFSAAAQYQLNTGGEADELRYDLAYTFRLSPASYTEHDTTSLFGVLETNGLYETNGDNEVLIAPGIQYVTQNWTIEATLQLPISQQVDNRMQVRWAAGVLVRLRF
ncbi:hypothetical protein MNBD_PLANCTO03-685 [hydrothermal vent metagenome]|uniref:Transporter n=1 Tax=hydrothermal vent metagenome TaxID=652676 RepID=A0A3B1E6V1_9ZZZZ